MTKSAPLTLDLNGAIARIYFNRPEVLNAVNQEMSEAFLAAVKHIACSPGVRVISLRGQGRAFMAGGDLLPFQTDPVQTAVDLIAPMHEALEILASLKQPVLASLHGSVAGAGLSIALAADLAIAADDTTFSLAYSKLGASPDVGGTWHLPRIVGLRKAMELALLSGTFNADEALRLSIINRIVPAESLVEETERLLMRLAAGPTFAYGQIKGLLRGSLGRDLHSQLDAESAAFEACAATADFSEGISAFFHKRAANFHGN
ncbi:MAG: enoyl-CoA hydratase-related protein [Pseudomonadota bacterium]